MEKADIKSYTLPELRALMAELGEPGFRAGQVYAWLHRKNVLRFEEMTDLPQPLRAKLTENCYINSIKIKKRLVSTMDGTVKYLYGLSDGNTVETVRMQYRHGDSLCISTQVGCRMGCAFCASTIGGLRRNLAVSEMLEEVYASEREEGRPISTLVLMGIGEPLDNFENVTAFLRILSSKEGRNLSLRHVSLSTCGLVDGIRRLQEMRLPLTLSVSLHAPDNAVRDTLMPVNKKWDMDSLLDACREYFAATGRRISFEYAVIDGVNDSPPQARELARRLRGMGFHLNLIPVNPVEERPFARSREKRFAAFCGELRRGGAHYTVRRQLGADIAAACGQLRREEG